MKHQLLRICMILTLGVGIATLTIQPAKGNIQCLVSCYNDAHDKLVHCLLGCGFGDIGSVGCRDDCRRILGSDQRDCLRDCGPCPQ
jgi:hypothetical protein